MSRFRFMLRMFARKRDRLRVSMFELPLISEAVTESRESQLRGYGWNAKANSVCSQEPTTARGDAVPPSHFRTLTTAYCHSKPL